MPADNHHHRNPLSARSGARRSCIAIALCAITSLAIAGPAAAAGQATVTMTVNNRSEVEHFDGCGGSPGVTEYLTGREHLHFVEFTNGTLNVSYGTTFWVTEVSDDPTVPTRQRQ